MPGCQLVPIHRRNPLNRGKLGPSPNKSWPCTTSEMRALGLEWGKVLVNRRQPDQQGDTAPSWSMWRGAEVTGRYLWLLPSALLRHLLTEVAAVGQTLPPLSSSSVTGEGWLCRRGPGGEGGTHKTPNPQGADLLSRIFPPPLRPLVSTHTHTCARIHLLPQFSSKI